MTTSILPVLSCSKDENASPSAENHEFDRVSEMQDEDSQIKSSTCLCDPPKSDPDIMMENINPKQVQGEEIILQSKCVSVENVIVEKVVPGMEEELGSITTAQPTMKANETNISEILCVSQSAPNNGTTMNNINIVNMLMVKKPKSEPTTKSKTQKNYSLVSGISWKINGMFQFDKNIWQSHFDWFSRVNRGFQCLEGTYYNFELLVKVESAVGIMFNNNARSAVDGLSASAIYENWTDVTLGVTDKNLHCFLAKSPLFKYDIDGAVWKKCYLTNDPIEDIHWQGILYQRKIWANILEVPDDMILLPFLDALHPRSSAEIVTSISKKIKVPDCPRLMEKVVRMLCMLYAQGMVVKSVSTQSHLSPVKITENIFQINQHVNSQESDLSPDNKKNIIINATAVTQKETLTDAVTQKETLTDSVTQKETLTDSVTQKETLTDAVTQKETLTDTTKSSKKAYSEVLSLNWSDKQTPTQSMTRGYDATLEANDNLAMPLQVLPFTPIDVLSPGSQNPPLVTGNDLTPMRFSGVRKRGRPKKVTNAAWKKMTHESSSPTKKMTHKSSFPTKKMTPKSLADEKYFAPLSLGWVREIVYRQITESTRCDIYYHPPEGRKLRSRVDVEKYLHKEKIENLTSDNFTFFHGKIGCGPPYELERGANTIQYFKKRTSLETNGSSGKNTKLKVKIEGTVKKTKDEIETNVDIVSDEVTEATITNEVGETTGYEEFLRADYKVSPLLVSKTLENASLTANGGKLAVHSKTQTPNNTSLVTITNEVGETTGYEEFLRAEHNVAPLSVFKTSEIASSAPSVVKLVGPSKTQTLDSSISSETSLKGSSAAISHYRTAVTDSITAGEVKASSNNLKKRDVSLDNKWLYIVEKYEKRKKPSIIENANQSLSYKSGVKGDSNPTVSATNSRNRANEELPKNKLPLKLWPEAVVPLKPSTSGVSQKGMSQIKVKDWKELSNNIETPFPAITPNFEYALPVWTISHEN